MNMSEKLTIDYIVSRLRNPYGLSGCDSKKIRLAAADELERLNTRHTTSHETVQQWEDRTGETYPDDGPVWSILHNDMKSTKTWKLYEYKKARNNFNVSKSIVATHHGKPEAL